MGIHHLHGGGFTYDHGSRFFHVVPDMGHQRPHSLATHFLIARQRQMYWRFQFGGFELRHHGKGHCDEAFHIAGAAAIEPAVPFHEFKRIARPFLAVHRNNIRMARQHNATGDIRSNGGKEIGLLTRLVIHTEMGNAPAIEIALDKFNQRNVAIPAGGIKTHKLCQQRLRRIILFHFSIHAVLVIGAVEGEGRYIHIEGFAMLVRHHVASHHEAIGRG